MAKITYTNKVALNENPEIALINKVTDDDLNEIKSVVNTNDDNVGVLTNLTTTTKTNIVAAVNELNTNKAEVSDIGSTNDLTTSDKSTVVAAINEVNADKAPDDIILVQSSEPTSDTNILWINSGQIGTPVSEITNSYSTSTGIGYSANYVNNLLKTTIGTMTYNTTYFNTPVFNKISKSGNVVSIYFIAQKKADWSGNADIITGLPANSFGDNFRFSAHIGDDEYIPATNSSRIMLWTQINGTSIRCYNGAITNNKYVHINLTYITND